MKTQVMEQKPISEWSALEIAIYAVNCGNSEDKIEEVEMMISAAIQSELSSAQEKNKWISVSERMPKRKDKIDVWICRPGQKPYRFANFPTFVLYDEDLVEEFKCNHITYWMYQPEPPKELISEIENKKVCE